MKCYENLLQSCVSKIIDMNRVYQQGRCDFIFDMHIDSASVKDNERQQRAKSTPVVLSTAGKTPLQRTCKHFGHRTRTKSISIFFYIVSLLLNELKTNKKRTFKSMNVAKNITYFSSFFIFSCKIIVLPSTDQPFFS